MRTNKPPDPLDQLIGRNVRFYRLKSGLSQSGLGASIGASYQQIQKYEKAANRIPASRLIQIARALRVPAAAFWGRCRSRSKRNRPRTSRPARMPAPPHARRLEDRRSAALEAGRRSGRAFWQSCRRPEPLARSIARSTFDLFAIIRVGHTTILRMTP
jgi:transcriptional regulator with XRE-family HTH domain